MKVNLNTAIDEVYFIKNILSKYVHGDEELSPSEINNALIAAYTAINTLREIQDNLDRYEASATNEL